VNPIKLSYAETPPRFVSVALPPSKSIVNRLLVMRALAGCHDTPSVAYACDDTRVMAAALASGDERIDIAGAGTAMRFLTAYFAQEPQHVVRLDGNERMRERPIGDLVDVLRTMGADITYADRQGFPPLLIRGQRLRGGDVTLRGDVSSQFVTALMMILPYCGGGTITLTGAIRSLPYIEMTAALMRQCGAKATLDGNRIVVEAGTYDPQEMRVEADWSAAGYWFAIAALAPDTEFALHGLTPHSLQGDSRIAALLAPLGVKSRWDAAGVLHLRTDAATACPCASVFADLNDMPDAAPTIGVLLCLLNRPFLLTGLQSLRIKESDRLQALTTELRKLGFVAHIEGGSALRWKGERVAPQSPPVIHTYGDHRMAMAFAPASISFPSLGLDDADVVNKSYPDFWAHLARAGVHRIG